MICLGACLAIWLTLREVDRLGLNPRPYLTACLIAFSSGIVGARIMNCIVFYHLYRGKPWWKMLAVWEGGLAMYGGVLLAAPLCYLYIRHQRLSFWQVADTLAPAWMALLIVARLGCFLNGCCYGKPTTAPWGLFFRDSATLSGYYATTHPTQLYSSFAALVIFMIMWRVRRNPRFTGQVSLVFPILYPLARFVIEFYRADPRGMWHFSGLFTLSESQVLSIPVFLFGLGAWMVLRRRNNAAHLSTATVAAT
jgi:phosphatidylglycerol:prolipoprotein diacylglycerol transferase